MEQWAVGPLGRWADKVMGRWAVAVTDDFRRAGAVMQGDSNRLKISRRKDLKMCILSFVVGATTAIVCVITGFWMADQVWGAMDTDTKR